MTDLTDAQWSDYARGQGVTVAPRVYEGIKTMTHDPAMVEKVDGCHSAATTVM